MRATGHHQKNNICIMRILEEKRKGQKIFLKQEWLKTVQTWGEKWTSTVTRPKGDQTDCTPKELQRHIVITLSKVRQERI